MSAKHTIRVAAKRTGLSPHLIRIWERRYSAVVPQRTPTGRRFYSDEDITRLQLLKRATEAGETIGQIANLTTDELESMTGAAPLAADNPLPPRLAYDPVDLVERCLVLAQKLDGAALRSALLEASAALGQHAFLDKVVMPLAERSGSQWEGGNLRVSQEHLITAVLRSILGGILISQPPDANGPMLIAATPAGQRHEIGALAAAVSAAAVGWRSVYLGPDLPSEEIASAVIERGARAVALSLVYPADDPRLPLELRQLATLLGGRAAILVGGRAAAAYAQLLDEIGALRVNSLPGLRATLNELRYQPLTAPSDDR